MKSQLLLAAIAALSSTAAFSQQSQTPPAPPPPPGPTRDGGPGKPQGGPLRDAIREKMLERLAPRDRQRFEEARKQALADPRIAELRARAEAANREFFEAMRAKMNELDPGLEGLLKREPGADGGKGRKELWEDGKGMSALSEGERQRLMAAREVARQTPGVQAAEQKRQAAQTPEERRAASVEYAKAMRDAILAADPSLAPVLDKLGPPGHRKEGKGASGPGETADRT